MSAIKLSAGKKIQRCSEHAHPCGNCHGMKIEQGQRRRSDLAGVTAQRQYVLCQEKHERVSKLNVRRCRTGRRNVRQTERHNQYWKGNGESRNWARDSNIKKRG